MHNDHFQQQTSLINEHQLLHQQLIPTSIRTCITIVLKVEHSAQRAVTSATIHIKMHSLINPQKKTEIKRY